MRNDRQHDRSLQGSCDGEFLHRQSHSNQRQRTDRDYDGDSHNEHKSGDDHAFKGSAPRHRSIAIHCEPGCYMVDLVRHHQPTGLFTAPASAATCNIKATSTANSTNTATVGAVVTTVNYTTRKNGNSGTGVQTNELTLTPANVSSGKFAQIWTTALDGPIWGQPLYLNGVTIPVGGKARNAVFVTTSNDSVYALDADTGALLWHTSFLSTGVTAVAGTSLQISSQIGILSTPVIDPVKQIMYVVAETSENNATTFPHRLHALSILTGKEMLGGPVLISDPDLPPVQKFQRPGLLLANGKVYVAFGSIEDRNPYHGLIFAFDQNNLEVVAFFNDTPTGSQGGIWMSGSSPTADKDGNIYVSTGNGSVSANNFGQAIVKLTPNLQELDFFIPHDYVTLNQGDIDLGSGSVMVVPDQAGPVPHLLIACGKPTPIYVLNRDAMGEVGRNERQHHSAPRSSIGKHGQLPRLGPALLQLAGDVAAERIFCSQSRCVEDVCVECRHWDAKRHAGVEGHIHLSVAGRRSGCLFEWKYEWNCVDYRQDNWNAARE